MAPKKNSIYNCILHRLPQQISWSLNALGSNLYDKTCSGHVPNAIRAFLNSENFEDSLFQAACLDGDISGEATIAGSLAEAFYGSIPDDIITEARNRLDDDLNNVVDRWQKWVTDKQKSKIHFSCRTPELLHGHCIDW